MWNGRPTKKLIVLTVALPYYNIIVDDTYKLGYQTLD